MPAEKVTTVQMYVLGDRDFPLAPVSKLRGDVVEPLGEIVAQARQRMPDTSYEDVLKLLVRVGLSQIPLIFEAGGRIEHGGMLSFTPLTEGRKSARVSALRAKLLDTCGTVLLDDREAIPEHTPPVDTIPVPKTFVPPVETIPETRVETAPPAPPTPEILIPPAEAWDAQP